MAAVSNERMVVNVRSMWMKFIFVSVDDFRLVSYGRFHSEMAFTGYCTSNASRNEM